MRRRFCCDMLLAARNTRSLLSGLTEEAFMTSRLHRIAVIRSLEVIGEAAGKISAETRGPCIGDSLTRKLLECGTR